VHERHTVNLRTACTRMFLQSHPVYVEESPEPWLGTTLPSGRGYKDLLRDVGWLRFLLEEDVAEGMTYLRENIPYGFEPLLQYFDNTHVSSSYHQIQPSQRPDGTISPIRISGKSPMFAPSI